MRILVKIDVQCGAVFGGEKHRYRYELTRSWQPRAGKITYIMLNPSSADTDSDDPTIAKCQTYARLWGYGRISVVNLFAFRATLPGDMKRAADPVGPENDLYIERSVRWADLVICAWGTDGAFLDRGRVVLARLRELDVRPTALRLTKDGHPSHPLYLPLSLRPEEI